jgi:uncharacterized membrane protein YbhN (UPF0104 family)
VGAAVALYALAILAAGARWRIMVRVMGGRISFVHAVLVTLAGVAVNNVTPSGRLAGEAGRIAVTRLKGQLPLALGAVASLGDRVGDLVAVFALSFVALPSLWPLVEGSVRPALAAAAIGGTLALVFGPRLRRAARSWLIARRRELKGAPFAGRDLATVLGLSLLVWCEDALRLMAAARAVGVDLAFPQGAALCVVMVLGGLVPTVGGLGVVEGGLVGAMVLFGIPLDAAIAITAVERAISYVLSTALGAGAIAWLGGRSLLSPPAVAAPADADFRSGEGSRR